MDLAYSAVCSGARLRLADRMRHAFVRAAGVVVLALALTVPDAGLVVCLPLQAAPVAANADQAPDVKADIVLLVDSESGTTLYERNADKTFFPANLTKMVTLAIVFDRLRDGTLTLDQDFPVSEHAWRTGGAPSRTLTMFAPINSRVKISDLLRGIMVQSANDSSIILAEGIAGTEAEFANLMQKKAEELGMTKSVFRNPSGLPDPDQKTTARDLVKVATYLVRTYPDLYKIFTETEFTFNKIRQYNRYPLLNAGIGAEGGMVGGQKDQGFHLVGSTVQEGERMILVLAGAKAEKERGEEAKKAFEWGFRAFEQIMLFKEGESVGEASVFGGERSSVAVMAQKPVRLLLQRNSRSKLTGKVLYRGPVLAPVKPGQEIGKLVVYRDDQPIQETPVYARDAVEVGSLTQRASDAAYEYVWGKLRKMIGLK